MDLGLVAHELGSALAPARNAVQLLQRRHGGDPDQEHLLGVAARGLERAGRVLQSLASLVLLEETAPRLEPMDLAEVVRRLEEDYRAEAAARGIAVELDIDAGLQPVPVERFALEQVLANLISNALKFTPPGGQVRLTLARARGAVLPGRMLLLAGGFGPRTNFVQLRIVDTGVGLTEETRRRLFQPFYRGPESARLPGMGLGLAVSLRLVSRMRGDLRPEPDGPGASFVVTLPADARTRELVERVDAVVGELGETLAAGARNVALIRLVDGPRLQVESLQEALRRRLADAECRALALSETTSVVWSAASMRAFVRELAAELHESAGPQAGENLRVAVRRGRAGAGADPLLLQTAVRCRRPLSALLPRREVLHGQDPGRGR